MAKSTSALSRTQNIPPSPLSKLPEEVLLDIFLNVVFGHKNREIPCSPAPSMEEDILIMYRRLYHILGVCSAWKSIVLDRGVLWSVIPMIMDPSKFPDSKQPFQLALQRSGQSKLYLAITIPPSTFADFVKVLTEHGSRLRAVNFRTSDYLLVKDAIERLLECANLETLSELSFHVPNDSHLEYGPPSDFDQAIPIDTPLNVTFPNLLGNLSAFRVSGINFYWDTMKFSSRLAELRIEDVTLGYDDKISSFVSALSSATGLRDLQIVSVATVYSPDVARDASELSPITFPNLRSLLVQDLYFNTLELLLPIIAPSTYQVAFTLTYKGLMIHKEPDFEDEFKTEDIETDGYDTLCRLLEHMPVNTLAIIDHCWLRGPRLRGLLKAMPALETLKLNGWALDDDIWENLHRFHDPEMDEIDPKDQPLPALKNLYLTSARILCWDGFKEMVISYPLVQIVMGGTSLEFNSGGIRESKPLEADGDLVTWLKTNALKVHLVDIGLHIPECYQDAWRLW